MSEIKFMAKAEIEKAIASVANRGKKLDADIQKAGLSILNHIQANGEVSLANKLWHALPKGARRNALVEWFLKYGKISVNTNKEQAKEFPLVFRKDGKTDISGAQAQPWYDCKPEKAPIEEFDFSAALARMIKQIKAATEQGIAIKGNEAAVAAVLALEGKLNAAPTETAEASTDAA